MSLKKGAQSGLNNYDKYQELLHSRMVENPRPKFTCDTYVLVAKKKEAQASKMTESELLESLTEPVQV